MFNFLQQRREKREQDEIMRLQALFQDWNYQLVWDEVEEQTAL